MERTSATMAHLMAHPGEAAWQPPAATGTLQPALFRSVLRITLLYAGFAIAHPLFIHQSGQVIPNRGTEFGLLVQQRQYGFVPNHQGPKRGKGC